VGISRTDMEFFSELVTKLKSEGFHSLYARPSTEKILVPNSETEITIYKVEPEDQSVKIIVQMYKHTLLGMGDMYVQGFSKNLTGSIAEISEDDLYDYT
jgi:hypothetical protein